MQTTSDFFPAMREAAQVFVGGTSAAAGVTATLAENAGNAEALAAFAQAVAELRNAQSSAELGDCATALKRATAKRAEGQLTFSFKKVKSPLDVPGMPTRFNVAVKRYVAPVKSDYASVIAGLIALGKDAIAAGAPAALTQPLLALVAEYLQRADLGDVDGDKLRAIRDALAAHASESESA